MSTKIKETVQQATARITEALLNKGFESEMLQGFDLQILQSMLDDNIEYKEPNDVTKATKTSITTIVLDALNDAENNRLPYATVYEIVRDYKCQQKSWFNLPWSDVKIARAKYDIELRYKLPTTFDIDLYNKINTRVKNNIASHITHTNNDSTSNNTLNKLVNKEGKEVQTDSVTGIQYIKLVTQEIKE